jgi:hypothetical protein
VLCCVCVNVCVCCVVCVCECVCECVVLCVCECECVCVSVCVCVYVSYIYAEPCKFPKQQYTTVHVTLCTTLVSTMNLSGSHR